LDDADILIAMTPSTTVNQTTAQMALHERHLEQVRIGLDENDRVKLDPVLERAGAEIAFGRAIPFDIWQHQLENGRAGLIDVDVTERNVTRKAFGDVTFSNDAVPLLVRRSGRTEIVTPSTRVHPGDRLTLLARSTDPEKLRSTLGIVPTS
jgi:Trk K+ transport system NAD-binding subunit